MFVIAEPCIGVKDTACVTACPVDCIHPMRDEPDFETPPMLYINPIECIDCGACVPVCPVSAIYAEGDLPDRWAEYQNRNAAYYVKQKGGPVIDATATHPLSPASIGLPLRFGRNVVVRNRRVRATQPE